MGVVFKADDARLNRIVALKFLPRALTNDVEAKRRFIQEAQAASAIQHNNICIIHDIEETDDGQLFIVMDYYDAETLKKKIDRGPLRIEEALDIALQVARGLSAAHQKGIVHRDVKPGNILVTGDGTVKLVDFGLAKLSASALLTKSGPASGTVAYMSPEQALGDAVDARSDIWSLGAVTYEMLTGRRPFEGDYEQAVVYSILHLDPKPLRGLHPEIPEPLDRIVHRAMARAPSARYQSAADLIRDGQAFAAGDLSSKQSLRQRRKRRRSLFAIVAAILVAVAIISKFINFGKSDRITSIAVLPFRTVSADSTQEYFTYGLTEELITSLWRIGSLRVRPMSSVVRYSNSQKNPSEIGRELGVDGVVVASTQQLGRRIRVTVRLVEISSDNILWTQEYEGDAKDVFVLQSQISQAVASELKADLFPQEKARLAAAQSVHPEAHDAYLKGQLLLREGGVANSRKAIVQFRRALQIDSNFALGYLGYSAAIQGLSNYWTYPPEEEYSQVLFAVTKAIEKDPNLAQAHSALAVIKAHYQYDLDGAEPEYKKAIELNPGSVDAHEMYAWFLQATGRFDEGVGQMKQAMELDPLDINKKTGLAQFQLFYGHYLEAIKLLQDVFDEAPSNADAHALMGYVLLMQGKYTEALAQIEEEEKLSPPGSMYVRWDFAWVYAKMGNQPMARKCLDELLKYNQQRYFNQCLIAAIYGQLGKNDSAFVYLDKAYARHEGGLVGWLKAGPALDPLRSDPRYAALLKKTGLDKL